MNKITEAGPGPLPLSAVIGLSVAKEENMTNNLIIFSFKGLQIGLGFSSTGLVQCLPSKHKILSSYKPICDAA